MSVWRLLLGFVGLLVACQTPRAAPATPEAGPLVASGTVGAREIHVAGDLGGRIVAVHAAVGDVVEVGDLLIELDATPLQVQLSDGEAEVAVAVAELALLLAEANPAEVAAARANLQLAEAQRRGARAAWLNARNAVENPQALDAQIAEARTQVNLAVQGVELARAELQQRSMLRDQHEAGSLQRSMADLQVAGAAAALAAAEADQIAAQTLLNWLYAIRNEPLGLIARANLAEGVYRVREAGTQVALAEVYDVLAGATPEEIAVAEAAVALARARLDVLHAQQARFAVHSLGTGVVVDMEAFPGEVVAPAATIIRVADLHALTLSVYVPENRLGTIALEQEVTVTSSSLPGRVFRGIVETIGHEPEFTPRNVATVEERLNTFYAVEIQLENPLGLLKPGMPAEAAFTAVLAE